MSQIDPKDFSQPGLYLLFLDGHRLDLTEEVIHRTAQSFLDDPVRLPQEVKAAAEYQPCQICPKRETAEICHAIMVLLPFVDQIDRYLSYDSVTAIFRDQGSNILHVAETTMQEALKYLSLLSLMHYCEVGQKFLSYFRGVNPLMAAEEIARCVFRNLYVKCEGDLDQVQDLIQLMQDEIEVTTRCQMDRMRLICRNDAFLNAFVSFQTTAEWLEIGLGEMVGAAPGDRLIPNCSVVLKCIKTVTGCLAIRWLAKILSHLSSISNPSGECFSEQTSRLPLAPIAIRSLQVPPSHSRDI